MTSPNRARSFVWKYFSINTTDQSKAKCSECGACISRGTSVSAYSTKPLINHLKAAHRTSYNKFQAQSMERTENRQEHLNTSLNVPQAAIFQGLQPWPANKKTGSDVNRRITEMIAIDMHPFSIVEDVGFRRLINAIAPRYVLPERNYFTEDMTQLYHQVKEKLKHIVDSQSKFAFTTDLWTSKHAAQYSGIACHWINEDFERKMAILQCIPFCGSRTSLDMSDVWKSMCDEWKITKSKVISVITDNTAHTIETFEDLDINHVSCFVHTIQLALRTGLLEQKSVISACATARKLVYYVKHSSTIDRFIDIRNELNLPARELILDDPTRWNSTFNMLERLAEQKRAVVVYVSEIGDVSLPTVQQWELIDDVLMLMRQFSQLVADASKSDNSISYVVPAIAATKFFLEFDATMNTDDINVMRRELLETLCTRFDYTMTDKNFVLATTLDPRYKLKYFSSETVNFVKAELSTLFLRPPASNVAPSGRSLKKIKLEGFWDCFDLAAVSQDLKTELDVKVPANGFAVADDFGTSGSPSVTCSANISSQKVQKSKVDIEMEVYFGEPTIKLEEEPLTWWRHNWWRFPLLSEWARHYLAPPCSGIASERLFGASRDAISEDLNRSPTSEGMDLQVFLKINLPLIDFDYL